MPFVFNIIGMWGVRIVGTLVCTQVFDGGLVAAWGCMILHNLLLFVLFLICLVSGAWNPLKAKRKASA
jgi:Na+-driven multidrug efflux pump